MKDSQNEEDENKFDIQASRAITPRNLHGYASPTKSSKTKVKVKNKVIHGLEQSRRNAKGSLEPPFRSNSISHPSTVEFHIPNVGDVVNEVNEENQEVSARQ
jgi:hypothetical protein